MEILNYEVSSKIMKPLCALHHRSRDEHRQASNQHSRWSCSVAHYSSTLLSSQHSGWPPTWSCVIKTVWLIEINKPFSSFNTITPGEGPGPGPGPGLGGSGQNPPSAYQSPFCGGTPTNSKFLDFSQLNPYFYLVKSFSVYFLLFPYPKKFSQFFSSHWKK